MATNRFGWFVPPRLLTLEKVTGISEGSFRLAAPRLRQFVRGYSGYRLQGFAPGEHVGMPSPYLTVIITIGDPLDISRAVERPQDRSRWHTLASGIASVPCTISHDGNQHGIQAAFTPLGARAIFGVPTAALGGWMVELDELIGADARELRERVALHDDWPSRFDVLDEIFLRRADDYVMDPALERAWGLLVGSGGGNRVAEVATDVGWSRRHLVNKFSAEFGVTPKDSARIARFSVAHEMLRQTEIPPLAEVAARCGYYDQAHMARDWRDLAGMAPSVWRAAEVFAFVQGESRDELADWTA
jgi:AraC-like DNA-binding protein